MGEKPILFSAPMVRALLAGAKTQTRRVIRDCPDPREGHHLEGGCSWSDWKPEQCEDGSWAFMSGTADDVPIGRCPYGVAGDRLWCRETWAGRVDIDGAAEPERAKHYALYAADNAEAVRDSMNFHNWGGKWRPSIFMPRWASRITLEIMSVRVERVQDITEADAKAEGVGREFEIDFATFVRGKFDADKASTHRLGFKHLWDSINGPRGFGWDANPWVWCVGFKRVEQAPEVVR